MNENKVIFEGLTFDDILLVPGKSSVLPREVDISTKLTTDIELNIPFISAAMDTVTESKMAIAMAQNGGIGIIHKNLTVTEQAEEVDKVKRYESGMIHDPITLTIDKTVGDAEEIMHKYHISGIPIIDKHQKLIGIITNRDLRFAPNFSLPVAELMTRENLITAPVGTTLEGAKELLQKYKIEKLPVVDDSGILRGLITFKDISKKEKYPNACKDNLGRLRVGAAVGVSSDTLDRVAALVSASVDTVIVDTAHGHSRGVVETVAMLRKTYPDLQLIAGNIVTAEAAEDLIDAGVNAVKVGIGAGSICTTRIVAGVGVPQVSAIFKVAEAVKKKGIPLIADGGIKQTGDVPKAIAAGADSVMIGGMFAGVEETPGEKVLYEGRSFKEYRGMGSLAAMKKGSKDRYFQDMEDDIKKLVPEGIEGRVPYKGALEDTLHQFIGGLRAAMGYVGAPEIDSMKNNARFVKITGSGLRESHPHDVIMTKEAPNYQINKS